MNCIGELPASTSSMASHTAALVVAVEGIGVAAVFQRPHTRQKGLEVSSRGLHFGFAQGVERAQVAVIVEVPNFRWR